MNMGMAEMEMNEKLERLHRDSPHDDGCATMYPGGKCDCTKQAIRTGVPYPHIPLVPARTSGVRGLIERVSNAYSGRRR